MNFFQGFDPPKFQNKFKQLVNPLTRSLNNLNQPQPQEQELNIETPTNVRHQFRAFFNKATGKIEGLPPEMKELLKEAEVAAGIF